LYFKYNRNVVDLFCEPHIIKMSLINKTSNLHCSIVSHCKICFPAECNVD